MLQFSPQVSLNRNIENLAPAGGTSTMTAVGGGLFYLWSFCCKIIGMINKGTLNKWQDILNKYCAGIVAPAAGGTSTMTAVGGGI